MSPLRLVAFVLFASVLLSLFDADVRQWCAKKWTWFNQAARRRAKEE